MDVLTTISTAIEIAKKLREVGKKVSEADFRMLLADLTNELGDAKLQAANLKIELAEARAHIETLERRIAVKSADAPQIVDGAYIFEDANKHYCTGCYDSQGQKILLRELSGPWVSFGKWECPACEKTFG